MDPFLIDSLFQVHHVTYHVLPISYRSNKKSYGHAFLWNHSVIIHTWELLHSIFICKRNKHIIYSFKIVSLKNINIQKFQCSFQEMLFIWSVYRKIFMVWHSTLVGSTLGTFYFVLVSTASAHSLPFRDQDAPPVVVTCGKHKVMTNHQVEYLGIGKNSLFSWPQADKLHLSSYITETEQKI